MSPNKPVLLSVLLAAALLVGGTAVHAQGTLFVQGGNVGIGKDTPGAALDILGDLATTKIQVENNKSNAVQRLLLQMTNNGSTGFLLSDTSNGIEWKFAGLPGGNFEVTKVGSGGALFRFDTNGNFNVLQGVVIDQSSRASKTSLAEVNTRDVLSKVVDLPIREWSYRHTDAIRHMGPMAEDFHGRFGLGATSSGIASLDTSGVALAAIQGLHEVVAEKDQRISHLEAELAELKATVAELAAGR